MITRKRIIKEIQFLAVFALLSFCLAIAAVAESVSLRDAISFSLFQTVLIFLPGMLLLEIFFSQHEFDPLVFFFSAYAIGYSIIILEYFFIIFPGINSANSKIAAIAVLTLTIIIYIVKKPEIHINKLCKNDAVFILLFGVLIAVIYFASIPFYMLPDEVHSSVKYHRDGMYWIENAAALKISFPPQELRYSGMQLFYHFFISIYVAFASLITGADTFSIGWMLSVLTRAALLYGGVYVCSKVLIKKDLGRVILIVSLLFSTGIERNTQSAYVSQLIYLPFGFDCAIGFGAYSIALLSLQYKKEQFHSETCFCSMLAMLMCVGHKAPVALIYMLFAGIICAFWLMKKQYGKAFLNGISLVVAFLFVMVICIGLFQSGESRVDAGVFGINANLRNTRLYEWHDAYRFADAATVKEKVRSIMTWGAALVVMILSFNPLMFFLDTFGAVSLVRRKEYDVVDLGLLAAMVFGICMGSFNEQNGMSQMYYSQSAFLPGLVFGIRNIQFNKRKVKNACMVISAALLIFQIKLYADDENILKNIRVNAEKLFSDSLPEAPNNNSEYEFPPDSMQYTDYQALTWIRDNTPIDSIVVSDRDIRLEQHTYMYHGTFTERQMYLEGDCYLYGAYWREREERRNDIRLIYLNYPEALEKARNDGVDYLIETKWITPEFKAEGCTLVYETETVRVWKI